MFPGLGGLDPRKMNAMMKQLGIKQEEIEAERVVIEKTDGDKIVIENPNVTKIEMHGQESFQISGNAKEESAGVKEEDINLVMEKTGKSEKEVRKVLEETGDIAEAILQLNE